MSLTPDIGRVLAEHRIECTGLGEVTCAGCRDRGWISWHEYRAHVADHLAALLGQHVEAAKREALLAAAEECDEWTTNEVFRDEIHDAHRRHLTAVIEAHYAQRVRDGQAEALEQAAENWDAERRRRAALGSLVPLMDVSDWLRQRAAGVRGED